MYVVVCIMYVVAVLCFSIVEATMKCYQTYLKKQTIKYYFSASRYVLSGVARDT